MGQSRGNSFGCQENNLPAVHVRDVPEPTLAALRERAARRGRSMQEELREILQRAAAEPVPSADVEPVELITVRTSGESGWRREEIYGDDGR